MDASAFSIWLGLGAVFVLAEFLLPGLVSVFMGLGALTVALALHMGWIDNVPYQLITFFVSSLVYVFTIRVWVVRFFPQDTTYQNIDEDKGSLGSVVEVVETIPMKGEGRISHRETTWAACSNHAREITAGTKVEIVRRENITYWVEPIKVEEN
jgi:membrane protein implicated in regulation of membrane protease activity